MLTFLKFLKQPVKLAKSNPDISNPDWIKSVSHWD